MSCSRFQFELSQCLDGRLPGARRGEVLGHVDSCPTCSRVWEEMQAAQSLVFGLAEPQVAPSFRDTVWDRIQAGEGAPEVLLSEPVSTMAKIRYGFVGAAAAALLLVATNAFLGGNDTPTPEAERVAARTADDEPAEPATPPRPSDHQALGAPSRNLAAAPLTAATLANHTVHEVKRAARRLKRTSHSVLDNPNKTPGPVWIQIRNDVQMLGDGLDVLGTLEREKLVEFVGPTRYCMQHVRVALLHPGVEQMPDATIQSLVSSLDMCSLESLDDGLKFPADAVRFTDRLVTVVRREPRIQRMLMRMDLKLVMPDLDLMRNGTQQPLLFYFADRDGRPAVRVSGRWQAGSEQDMQFRFHHMSPPPQDQPEAKPSTKPGKLKLRSNR